MTCLIVFGIYVSQLNTDMLRLSQSQSGTAYPPGAHLNGVHAVKLHVFPFQVLCCNIRCQFHVKRYSVRLYSHLFCRGFVFYLCHLYLFTDTGILSNFRIQLCSLNNKTTGVTNGAGTANPSRVHPGAYVNILHS